ncbi:putative HTH domain DNA-binding protein [Caulobacter phage CcrRogue]|uniref:Putative HTH domain DNA-binding protein n=1 Tax=Caulobacter phage CcrRogue TaxID=2927986 RepID=K4JS69_9CAUD|nr:putative HTH domain DNA-binding protein [Caulobacter phage CcrRogue]AFU86588.1 putative HTH domain DNA-binding protein [Caulobacter phage CcrRogue]
MQTVIEMKPGVAAHRSRSLIHKDADLAHPRTIGQRITACRMGLGLTQEQVASRVYLTQQSNSRKDVSTKPGWEPKQAGERRPLARTAYIMYESDSVKPHIDVLEQIAHVLKTTPEYITFGVGAPNPVEELTFKPRTGEFQRLRTWNLDPDWLRERFEAEPTDLALAAIHDFAPGLNPGDMAVVRRDVEPNAAGGEFVYGLNKTMQVAHVTRPSKSGPYRIYDADLKDHIDVDAAKLVILGKVVGKVGALTPALPVASKARARA